MSALSELAPEAPAATTAAGPRPNMIDCPRCGQHRKHDAHGWCRPCGERWRRAGRPAEGPPPPRVKPQQKPCENCGTPFPVRPCEIRKAEARGNQPPRFCSVECQHEAYRGNGNPKWRGGTVRQVSGYIYEYAPDHPHATQAGYVMQHRLVMERAIGRHLTPTEQVHHRNHIRDDNRLENLELMPDVSAHREHHGYFETQPCGTCATPVRRSLGHRRRWSRAFCSRKCAALAASKAAATRAKGTAS